MSKKDFRIYCDEEYINHLKTVADEQSTSLNQLVLSTLTKKYPMPKRNKKPTLDIQATRKHYEEIDKYINEASTGGEKIKPYHLYLHLIEERDRLKKILDEYKQN